MASERSDLGTLPANLARTLPIAAYVSTAAYAIVFGSERAGLVVAGMGCNSLVNRGIKRLLARIARGAAWVRRPEGARDTGAFPEHEPKLSTSSGMPSGHAQGAAFYATVLGRFVWATQQAGLGRTVRVAALGAIAALVALSRTAWGGPFCLRVHGRKCPPHTLPQVLAGSALGATLGSIAFSTWWRA